MLGELTHEQIEELLSREIVGRIGCSANGITYVVPVNYAYDGDYIYSHSREGMKVQLMRINPMVCFEVDNLNPNGSWQSVIGWGRFEELKGNELKAGLQALRSRFRSQVTSETSMPADEMHQGDDDPNKTIIFRIELKEKSGRFESR